MKSLEHLLHDVLSEWGERCHVSTSRDFERISARIETEGFSFLTITLPNFCADFERSLARGRIVSSDFAGFQRRQGLPVFLQGFLRLVFHSEKGTLLANANIDAIRAIRQVCLMFKKIELPCTDKRVRAAIDAYVSTEKEVSEWRFVDHEENLREFTRVATLVWGDILADVDSKSLCWRDASQARARRHC